MITSCVYSAIRELELATKETGITVLNEVGMDPGIDHLYAIKSIGEVHTKGGKVSLLTCRRPSALLTLSGQSKEFYSYCGGLSAPEFPDDPVWIEVCFPPYTSPTTDLV